MANLCMSYLNFDCFGPVASLEDAGEGRFALIDYSVLYWLGHVESALRLSSDLDNDVREALEVFVERHCNNPSVTFKITKKTLDSFAKILHLGNRERVHQAVASTRKQLRYFGEMRPGEHVLNLQTLINRSRKAIEEKAERKDVSDFDDKYGYNIYKCPRFSCHYFTHGFATKAEQQKHSNRHKRPYRCDDEDCHGYKVGFAEENQLNKHNSSYHPDATSRSQVFPTDEEVAASMQQLTVEPVIEAFEPVPVTVVSEPSSESEQEEIVPVRPRLEVEQVKRARTKKEWTCQYCERTFGKKWNWQSHLATHEGGENLSCDRCGQICARSSDLNRHIRVQHSPAKLFKCSHCQKSFSRRDVLRNHHRSRQGQVCLEAINNRV
jgi:hypothetical protein